MSEDLDTKPWDIKRLLLSLGGEDGLDSNGFIVFEIFNNERFNIYEGDGRSESKWFYEEIDLEAARCLRDFLNYAVPDESKGKGGGK